MLKRRYILVALALFLAPSLLLAHSWMAPEEEAVKTNPLAADEKNIVNGRISYANHCAYCHGDQAEGLKKEESGLAKDTPDLKKRLKTHSEGDFHWKIRVGKGEMPPFADTLTDREIWEILLYLRSTED